VRRAAAAAALLLGTACGGGAEPKAATVSVQGLAFGPGDLTVAAGTTVTWRNDEPIGHTVTSGTATGIDAGTGLRSGERPDGAYDAPLTTKGATFTRTFDAPGTYPYYCAIHKGMNARVVVT
jgi:plastocyanin